MDVDGLPLIGPGIDYTKVEAINQKRTIAFINHFIAHTSHFLNRFSGVCEEKLINLHERIRQLEVSLSLLDAKLLSIPGLDDVTTTPVAVTITAQEGAVPNVLPLSQQTPTHNSGGIAVDDNLALNTVSKDPRYVKFFNMVQFGVPKVAVIGKMRMEGLDSSLLDTPNAPAPALVPADRVSTGTCPDSDDDTSDASFSD